MSSNTVVNVVDEKLVKLANIKKDFDISAKQSLAAGFQTAILDLLELHNIKLPEGVCIKVTVPEEKGY